jgi:uncharacterized protein YbjT (DUF2867 family)
MRVLVIGATGSIGRHVVAQAMEAGHETTALVRDADRARRLLPEGVTLAVGDGTDPGALIVPVQDTEAVVFTHGSHGGPGNAERIDYGIVRNAIAAAGERPLRIALMTAIGVTVHDGAYNRSDHAHDWKRRAERLVRRSGHAYTIVRPAWFDYNEPDQRHLVFLQGDIRRSGSPADGAIARDQIARVLLAGLTTPAAERKTLELVADTGPAQDDLEHLFAELKADTEGAWDAALDPDTLPLADEPADLLAEIDRITHRS